jgi:hypothetical protein
LYKRTDRERKSVSDRFKKTATLANITQTHRRHLLFGRLDREGKKKKKNLPRAVERKKNKMLSYIIALRKMNDE